jgi:hypothetical protein
MPDEPRKRAPRKTPAAAPRLGAREGANTVLPGQHVSGKGGRIRIIETSTGKVVRDFGPSQLEPRTSPGEPGPGDVPGIPDNAWIVYSQWNLTGSEPIASFSTTWVVPPEPASDDGQTIYLFNGMEQASGTEWILQPVLQWGPSQEGGGNYWAIGNWYVPPPNQGLTAQKTALITVNPGDVVQGVMTLTSVSGNEYSYTSSFAGHPSIDLTVTDIPQLTAAYETLECYGLTSCSDYPATAMTAMYDIEIKTGTPGSTSTDATLSWSPVVNFSDCGQNSVIVSDDSPGGAVYLYYHQPPQNFYFINDKSSFGADEVKDVIASNNGLFPAAFYLALEGFTPQQLTVDQPSLIMPTVSGPFSTLTGVQIKPSTQYPPVYDASSPYTPQRVLYPFDIIFQTSAPDDFPATGVTAELLNASITTGSGTLGTRQTFTASTIFDLAAGADPYFTNVDPTQDNRYFLSQDLRVFTISPEASGATAADGVRFTFQSGNALTLDSPAAYSYIQSVINHFNSNYSDPSGTDPFDLAHPLLPDQNSVYGGDSTVTPSTVHSVFPPSLSLNYNFALARVRMTGAPGLAGEASNVRVFFRLLTSQTFDTDYINTSATALSAGTPNVTYPSLPSASPNAPTSPLAGTDTGGTINGCSLPYSAASGFSDYAAGGINNQDIIIPSQDTEVWAYFGCYLNVYDSTLIGGKDSQQWLTGSSHSCLVAQLAYSGVPIENADGVIESPQNCVQLAQRNLSITPSGNPGFPSSHLIPQTFDSRPSPAPTSGPLGDYPDELMIDWRNTPPGSTAQIYWPAVAASDVLALAARLYPDPALSMTDPHTVSCEVGPGMTYIPIPAGILVPTGTAESFAGLITLQLPPGIHAGDTFNVIIRRVTSRRIGKAVNADDTKAAEAAERVINWRYVAGTFGMQIPVQHDEDILPGELSLLSFLRWRLQRLDRTDRWYPVLLRWTGVVARRIRGLGGNPAEVKPSQLGIWTGEVPQLPPGDSEDHGQRIEYTGKISAVRYDRFGDFEGFDLRTEAGAERCFRGCEQQVEELVRAAWRERTLISVFVHEHDHEWPSSIVLRGPAPR